MKISVIIDNYNYAQYLAEAIESALTQMTGSDSLIIVDDGSVDSSEAILSQYQSDPRVHVIRQDNSGQMTAIRNGVTSADGEIITLLDADDFYLPGYLDQLREIFSADPTVNFVATIPEIDTTVSADAKNTWQVMRRMQFEDGIVGPSKWSTMHFFEFVGYPTSGIAMRKSLADRIMAVPQSSLSEMRINPLLRPILRLPEKTGSAIRITADGFIVRCASLMDAVKYHNSRPGFHYRFHGENKYASLNRFNRWYVRTHRKKEIIRLCRETEHLPVRPLTSELAREIQARNWPRSLVRRTRFAVKYALLGLRSRGAPIAKAKLAILAFTVIFDRKIKSNSLPANR